MLELKLPLHIAYHITTSLLGQKSSLMDFWLSYAGFDLSDPEKEKMGILSLQLKEKNVLHSVRFILKYPPVS